MGLIELMGLVNLIIAFQAVFLVVHFLLKKKGIVLLNRLLALCIGAFGLVALNTFFSLAGYDFSSDLFQKVSNNVMWFIAPSLYSYVAYRESNISPRVVLWHLIPYLPLAAINILFEFPVFNSVIVVVAFLQMITYLSLAVYLAIKRYRTDKRFYSWVLPMLIIFGLLVLINVLFKILMAQGMLDISQNLLQGFTVLLSIPVFYTSYKEMNSGKTEVAGKRYQSTPIDDRKAGDILNSVEYYLKTERGFTDKGLTLNRLSEKTGISAKYISQVVNSRLGMSFSDYVSQLRIEEAARSLLDPSKTHLTIAAIADEAGFSSISRFNLLFKKQMQVTPKAYQKAGSVAE
ncbi:MAG: AraC family transcriptional regulator [Roseivirga sp.]|nr:AraC family transcriptional regulator [Roseivirga sp.]